MRVPSSASLSARKDEWSSARNDLSWPNSEVPAGCAQVRRTNAGTLANRRLSFVRSIPWRQCVTDIFDADGLSSDLTLAGTGPRKALVPGSGPCVAFQDPSRRGATPLLDLAGLEEPVTSKRHRPFTDQNVERMTALPRGIRRQPPWTALRRERPTRIELASAAWKVGKAYFREPL